MVRRASGTGPRGLFCWPAHAVQRGPSATPLLISSIASATPSGHRRSVDSAEDTDVRLHSKWYIDERQLIDVQSMLFVSGWT